MHNYPERKAFLPRGEVGSLVQIEHLDLLDDGGFFGPGGIEQRLRLEAAAHPALHPGRSARVLIEAEPIGWLGELHPRCQQKYELARPAVLFELDAASLTRAPLPHAAQPSRFPAVIRDIAVLVDAGTPAQAFLDAAWAEKPAILRGVEVFDLYQGQSLPAGKKSLAFRVVMQDTERTLTDAEADSARDALVALWGRRLGAQLRT